MATAFAVYSADDNSLNFYKRDTVPTAGSSFNGKTATAVYTGFETDTYTYDDTTYKPTTPWSSYSSDIASVNFVDSGITPVSTAYWFFRMDNASLTALDLSNLDTANVTDMSEMFRYCSSLSSLDVSHFNTANVTNMCSMFGNCSALTSLDVSHFNTANVTNMGEMFGGCSSLASLDVSHFNTANVTKMSYMFSNCSALISLDISSFDTANVTDMRSMFYKAQALTAIYVSDRWSTASVTSSAKMLYGCYGLPNFHSSFTNVTRAHYNSGGYLTYKQYIPIIMFVANSGLFKSDSSTTKSVKTNLDGTISLSTLVEFPIKQSYVFKGWSTTENGSVVYTPYATPTITDDTTLYAVWQKAESYLVREDTLVNIANAVRVKTGGTNAIALDDIATMIAALGPTISASGDTLTITN